MPRGIYVTKNTIVVSNALGEKNDTCFCPPNSVVVFNKATGQQLKTTRKEEEMKAPRGIVVDEDGSIFVADSRNRRILKFDKDCVRVGKPTCFEKTDDLQSYLFGMCIVDRKIYIADRESGCIHVLNLDLSQHDSFKVSVRDPTGIAFDFKENSFYVASETNGIERFDKQFKKRKKLQMTKKGEGKIKLYSVRGIAVSSKRGRIFVTEKCNKRILCFNMNEEYVKEAAGFVGPQVVALDPDDDYLYVGDDSGELHRIELNTFLKEE